jgi:hypothetical protein
MIQPSNAVNDDALKPGGLMHMVADELTARGLCICYPEYEGGRSLTITGLKGMHCEVTVEDSASVEWEFSPWASGEADPNKIADLATSLLTDHDGDYPRKGNGYAREGITLKGIVGLELAARGLDVKLEVYEDTTLYDVIAEIVAVNPDTDEDARVRICDSGYVLWECDYWPEAAIITWESEYSWYLADIGKTAHAIADKVARAVSHALPELTVT